MDVDPKRLAALRREGKSLRVKTRDWPGLVEALRLFPAPPSVRKLVHRYVDGRRLADVKEL